MRTKIVELEVLYKYTLEIDDDSPIVKDYEGENDLLVDCASYKFSPTLPVIDNGVKVLDSELLSIM